MSIFYMTFGALAAAAALTLAGCGGTGTSSQIPASSQASSQAPVHDINNESKILAAKAIDAYGKGKWEDALSFCDQALEKDPQNYKALSLKGLVYAFQADPDAGAQYIQQALDINPNYVQGFYDMAMAKKLGKHYDESIQYFQKVIDHDPNNTWSYYGIATDYADKRDKGNALAYLKKAAALDPKDVKLEAAIQDHFQWLHGDPDFESIIKIQ